MIPQGRPLFALVTVVVLLIFYLAGPFSAKPAPVKRISNADARLARWIEVVSPPGKAGRPGHAFAAPLHPPVRDQSKALVPIDLYPLGKPAANAEDYLNARKREKLVAGNLLQAQNAPVAKKASGGLSPLDHLPTADAPIARPDLADDPASDTSGAQKPNVAAGLSPLDSLPIANTPIARPDLSDDPASDSSAAHVKAVPNGLATNDHKIESESGSKANVDALAPEAVASQPNTGTAPLEATIGSGKSSTSAGKLDGRPGAAGAKPVGAKAAVVPKVANTAVKPASGAAAGNQEWAGTTVSESPAMKGQTGAKPAAKPKIGVPAQLADKSNTQGSSAESKSDAEGSVAPNGKVSPLTKAKGAQALRVNDQSSMPQLEKVDAESVGARAGAALSPERHAQTPPTVK